ncbi:MAG: hypothetical protein KJP02_05210 [Octadecabacter sp.]|nr:hypothetical protein [Octadecabacter sp.]
MTDRKTDRAGHSIVRLFRRDEDGSMIIFSLFMFILILWFGGMAVDLMRFETTRAKLQGTLDRATLAAADLDQTLPPEEVCAAYFEKSGLSDFLDSCVATEGLNFRTVAAAASAEMPLFFADLPAVLVRPFDPEFSAQMSTLTVSGTSTAEERVSDVEVSLILDVSGSMDRNNRIQNLRPAARDFVSTVLANNTNAPQGLITVSMIPYSAVVNPGEQIEPFLNLNRTHSYSACPLLDNDAFYTTTALDLNETYDHVAHFDPYWYSASPYHNPIKYPWCHVGNHNSIITHSTSEAALHAAINDLEPYGNTAIDLGMKWGVALLDPSTNPIVASLAGQPNTNVPGIAATRPEAFNLPDVLKVVVLMTDGENTSQYDLDEPYKSGTSFLWFNLLDDDGDVIVQDENGNVRLDLVPRENVSTQYRGQNTPSYYWDDRFHRNWPNTRWESYPAGYSSQWEYVQARENAGVQVLQPGIGRTYDNNVRNVTWQELFANRVYNDINNEWLSRPYNHGAIPWSGNNDINFSGADRAINYGLVQSGEADARLSDICEAARDRGIIIYTVAFEAPFRGRTALQDCASSPSHYFDVSGTDISEAFSAIASDIRALKLTR